jgi:NADP-dependent aldehyde dehydrogenase
MSLHGQNIIAGKISTGAGPKFSASSAADGRALPPEFHEATPAEIDLALESAVLAFEAYREIPSDKIAAFLDRIAEEIMKLGDSLIQRAHAETALPEARLTGERARTVYQLKMFADLVREGSWVEATIDRAQPERKPLPKPDLRRKLVPIGPVVVFSASNFPLAFSVAGGDTASALAAGNPVIVKSHSGHPGTSELVASAIVAAAGAAGMPAGVFSMLHGHGGSHEVSLRLVRHPATKAVGFTGSQRAGRALFNAAAARPEPIPVYAEMGSTNPVFILPGALEQRAEAVAQGLIQSVTLGVGQFCTNPGLVFAAPGAGFEAFTAAAAKAVVAASPGTMLYPGLCERFADSVGRAERAPGVRGLAKSAAAPTGAQVPAVLLSTDAASFQANDILRDEIFGPATLLVACGSSQELGEIARQLPGQLTATIHGTEADLRRHQKLISLLEQKAGRLVFNGFPTGVEVCPAMQHGGPYPATTDGRSTSVGTAAIKRFARPVCFQNFPQSALPVELRDDNQRQIWRVLDGGWTKADA